MANGTVTLNQKITLTDREKLDYVSKLLGAIRVLSSSPYSSASNLLIQNFTTVSLLLIEEKNDFYLRNLDSFVNALRQANQIIASEG